MLKCKLGGVADADGSDTGVKMTERLKTKAVICGLEKQSGGIKE